MAKGNVEFVKNDEYYTPKETLEFFGGGFDYDPATNERKALEFGIVNYDTIETNGLTKDWTKYKKIWCNPPFTRKFEFLEKAVQTYKQNNNIQIYFLTTTESICTKKFNDITKDVSYKVYVPNGRINFESRNGKITKSPAFSTVVIHFCNLRQIEVIENKMLRPTKEVE